VGFQPAHSNPNNAITGTVIAMNNNPNPHRRRALRLREFDYTQAAAYFVTVCTHHRTCLFGEITDGKMLLHDPGRIVRAAWQALPQHYPHVRLDAFVVMPNHIHGVIVLTPMGSVGAVLAGAGLKPAPTESTTVARRHGLTEIVRAFKMFSARRVNATRAAPGTPLWQRNYYEHVVRDEDELNRIREYIDLNPLQWDLDGDNPRNLTTRDASIP
jgi:putative transposase